MSDSFKTALGAIVVLALLGVLWAGYWIIAGANQDARYGVNTNSQQYQSALVSQQRDRVAAIDVSQDEGQRKNLVNTFCATQQELTRPPADLVSAAADLCN